MQRVRLAAWADAAYGGQTADGKCRMGFMFELMPSAVRESCHLFHWSSRFTRRAVKSCLGGEINARRILTVSFAAAFRPGPGRRIAKVRSPDYSEKSGRNVARRKT